MRFKNVCIESIVHHLPSEIISSEEIERRLTPIYNRLKLSFGRLEMFSGIKERRFWKSGTLPSEVAAQAGEKAIKAAGIDKDKIDCLINASVSRDFLEPATASIVHEKLNLSENTMIFDISNACLGFLNAMVVAANMIERGAIKTALIVAGENSRPLVESTIKSLLENTSLTRKEIKDSFASLTIGSGAAGIVLVHSSISKAKHYLMGGGYLLSSKFNNLCQGGLIKEVEDFNQKLLMKTNSETLLQAGCQLAKKTWEKTKLILGIKNEEIKRFICHQVGSAHRKLLCESLDIDIDKDFPTFPFLGNMGSVSVPVTLSIGVEQGVIKKNDMVALLGIGSGINSMMLGIQW